MVGVAGGGLAGRFAGGGGCKAGEGIEEGGFALCGRRRKSGCVDRESWEFSTWVRIANLLIKLEDFHASASESEIVCWGCKPWTYTLVMYETKSCVSVMACDEAWIWEMKKAWHKGDCMTIDNR